MLACAAANCHCSPILVQFVQDIAAIFAHARTPSQAMPCRFLEHMAAAGSERGPIGGSWEFRGVPLCVMAEEVQTATFLHSHIRAQSMKRPPQGRLKSLLCVVTALQRL